MRNARFIIAMPITLAVLSIFGIYHWGMRNGMDRPVLRVVWALAVGIPMGLGNVAYNLTVGSFVFWQWPPLRNTDGEFSPFFTTRIKAMRGDPLAERYVRMVNQFDPGHFAPLQGA